MTNIDLVPADAELLKRFYGEIPRRSMRAFVAVEDGEPIGVAGVYIDLDKAVIFSDRNRPVSKRVIAKACRAMTSIVRGLTVPVFAMADPGIEGSCALLEHMGFTHFQGDIWRN